MTSQNNIDNLSSALRIVDSLKQLSIQSKRVQATTQTNPYIHAATATNTREAYRSDIRHFEKCGGTLPASIQDIINYLQSFAATLNPRTLSRRLTALKQWHTYQGFNDPTSDPSVRKTLKGIMNVHGKPSVKAHALTLDELQQLAAHLEKEDTLIAHRDNALFQLGFFGAFRRSELILIRCEHIKRLKEGIEIIIPRSKTDQTGEGQHCAIPYGKQNLCPVRALDHWLNQSNITDGFIFRKINRWGKLGDQSLTPIAVTQIIKKRAKECEIPNAIDFSSHSFRRGLASTASQKGASLKSIMRQGRWRHVGTVLGYIEDGQRFNDNAAATALQDTP